MQESFILYVKNDENEGPWPLGATTLLIYNNAPDVLSAGCAAAACFYALGSEKAASKTVAVTGEINLR